MLDAILQKTYINFGAAALTSTVANFSRLLEGKRGLSSVRLCELVITFNELEGL